MGPRSGNLRSGPVLIAVGLASILLLGALIGALLANRSADQSSDLTFAAVFEMAGDGIVRVETVSCGGAGIGSGFLLSPTTAMTSAHVVRGAVSVGISTESTTTAASVTGIDLEADLAILTLNDPLPGHTFSFTERTPTPGIEVVALGYPLGSPLSLSIGTISGVNRLIDGYGDVQLLQTDTAVNQGNSGGPLVDRSGDVVGVIVGSRIDGVGLGYAVEAHDAAQRAQQWLADPRPSVPPTCSDPLGPDQDLVISSSDGDRDPAVIEVFTAYFGGINRGEYRLAWDQLGPDVRASTSLEEFTANTSTSYDFNVSVRQYEIVDANTHQVWITFTSLQDPALGPNGEACTKWSVDYSVRRTDDGWHIVDAAAHDTDLHTPC